MVGTQRAGAVAVGGVQANQHLVMRLTERVMGHQPFGIRYRGCVVPLFFQEGGQTAQHLGETLAILFALRLHPSVVQIAQQVVLVQARRFFQGSALTCNFSSSTRGGAGHRLVERDDIDEAPRFPPPHHRTIVGFEKAASRG